MCEFYTENAMYHPTCSWSDVINVAAKTGQVSTLGVNYKDVQRICYCFCCVVNVGTKYC